MYNADGSLKTVGKGRYKGGNSGGGSTSLGFGDGYEARCISICDQLTTHFRRACEDSLEARFAGL